VIVINLHHHYICLSLGIETFNPNLREQSFYKNCLFEVVENFSLELA